ncbi:hypothetical protein EJB05_19081, partial [Eragrostis curvula]
MAPSPPPPAASGAHQHGSSALPYAEDVKWLICNHLVALAEAIPSLHPKATLFTNNDGRAAHLLQADGSIPIHHAGVSYNLPAVIWLATRALPALPASRLPPPNQ